MKDFDQVGFDSITNHTPSPYNDGTADDRRAWAKLCNLQRRILPQIAPTVHGYDLALAYRPAFVVTGDYHDFFVRPDGYHAIFVGDGSGHGPAASMLMAIVRTLLHTHDVHRGPSETLTAVGRMFHHLIPSDLFMTGVYLLLGEGGELSWASAGHHPPLWVKRNGQLGIIDFDSIGAVLGLTSEEEYTVVNWKIDPGDRLFVFTDGLWDARNPVGEQFGRQRLGEYLAKSVAVHLHEVVEGLVEQVAVHLEGADFEDDFTLVAVESRP